MHVCLSVSAKGEVAQRLLWCARRSPRAALRVLALGLLRLSLFQHKTHTCRLPRCHRVEFPWDRCATMRAKLRIRALRGPVRPTKKHCPLTYAQDFETVTFSNRPTSARKPPGAGGGAPRGCGSAATSSGIAAAKLENETEELKRKQITSSMDCSCFLQHDIVQLSYIIARSRSRGTRRSRHLAFSHRPLTLAALASLSPVFCSRSLSRDAANYLLGLVSLEQTKRSPRI